MIAHGNSRVQLSCPEQAAELQGAEPCMDSVYGSCVYHGDGRDHDPTHQKSQGHPELFKAPKEKKSK